MTMISGIEKISDTELLFEFYGVYLSHASKEHETFDEFISWGKTLLKDYNEIDRELCNTNSLFDYLEAFKELNHWSNYEQETELIKKYKTFWSKIKVYHKDLIPKIEHPILILCPNDDLLEPTLRAEELLNNGELIILNDCSHGMFETKSQKISKIIENYL